ncbi:hypothetical protein [Pseudophaeobacter sp.]|uniref:hypothetical protein n=1 Tax=Pseudophaeobacter sp. TaxID=1971739 RepID=UPI0026253C4E|nr:hypothetical protein [Pseudophaeobacter sp.]
MAVVCWFMVIFEDIEDVEAWLASLEYVAFWDAVAPYRIFSIADRDHCDGLIAGGKVRQDTILEGIKAMARTGMIERFGLQYRRYESYEAQGGRSLH